ncbi:VOC family protein [Streptomyces triculaminicus]|uniref:VOC family protein n=2 Tax=Streptomyces TaxID=1883 RepID=A0A939FIX5_9ACTN|nr:MULTISPECIES: VOC family protein [Streptomyces]MBO0651438.1 VOC family protein [Streptomyces triculaminicus]QSY49744.1 VOC family protein [Streptomyces griseocarneus]
MSIELNHTIVLSRDKHESARFLADILGLEAGAPFGPFVPVATGNGVTLDFMTVDEGEEFTPQHYAFLVSEEEFDGIFERILRAGIDYWADPTRKVPRQINHNAGGRGVYFTDPGGHYLEVLTRPFGGGAR